jgi:hypothetical protein
VRLFHCIVVAALCAGPLAAQDISMGGITQSWTSSQLLLNSEKRAWAAPECVRDGNWGTACGAPSTDPAAPRQAEPRTRFTPSAAARQRGFAQMISQMRGADPAGAAALERELAGSDVIGAIGQRLQPLGLRTDDVADAMTVYVMESWEAVSGRPLPPNRARVQAVRRQMRIASADVPALAGASDATKQMMAESMLIQAAQISGLAEIARQQGGTQATQVADAVRRGCQATLGLDLRTLDLTDRGLVLRESGAR